MKAASWDQCCPEFRGLGGREVEEGGDTRSSHPMEVAARIRVRVLGAAEACLILGPQEAELEAQA